jgi:competence protein ComEA
MRINYFSSLVFALLSGVSVAVTAAPAAGSATAVPAHAGGATEGAMAVSAPASTMQEHAMGQVNLNTADATVLQKELIGIGKNKADAIVAYRDTNGPFTSVDELIEVKGIGKAILDKNRDKLTVE